MTETSSIRLSIVIPVRDEGESIAELGREIDAAFKDVDYLWECLWVDDGSEDQTQSLLEALNAKNGTHRFVILDGKYGQSAALYSGFQRARGEIIATLDGDGQNDPGDLPGMLKRLSRGEVDAVNGIRVQRFDSF